jgi:hypothetical protein
MYLKKLKMVNNLKWNEYIQESNMIKKSLVAIGLVVQWQDGLVGRYPPGFKSWCSQLFLDFPGFIDVMH